jgi:hypothetical protein
MQKKAPQKSIYNETCLAAVMQSELALQFVEKQTPEICLAAVRQNDYALEFVDEQTLEINLNQHGNKKCRP